MFRAQQNAFDDAVGKCLRSRFPAACRAHKLAVLE